MPIDEILDSDIVELQTENRKFQGIINYYEEELNKKIEEMIDLRGVIEKQNEKLLLAEDTLKDKLRDSKTIIEFLSNKLMI
jgi:hypothetical protein